MKKLAQINPPVVWLWIFILGLLGLSFAFGPTAKRLNLHEVKFSTTSSSLLYFKNIRSYYYDIDESRKPFVLYRLKERNKDTSIISPGFTIISNPLNDEAYVYIENEGRHKQYALNTVFITEADSDTLLYENISKMNNEEQFEMAASIYLTLINEADIYGTGREGKPAKLFADDLSRRNAEIVLEDYFKLVNKL